MIVNHKIVTTPVVRKAGSGDFSGIARERSVRPDELDKSNIFGGGYER